MKILFITEFFPTGKDLKFSGGVEARNFFLAKNLAKKHKVYVLTSKLPGTKKREKLSSFEVFRVGNIRSYDATANNVIQRIKFIISAIKFANTLDIDLVDSSNFVTHFAAKIVSFRKKIPHIAWYPDVWIGSWIKIAGISGVLGEILERTNLLLGANAYIAISKETASKLKKNTNRKVYVIACGVDQKEFAKTSPKFKNNTIICISRLAKYKNIRTLIIAFAHLSTKVKNVKLLIVGVGPEGNSLKELTKTLNIKNKVNFLSNLSRRELVEKIKSSHIFSLPSFVEGFGIATIEACAAGIPYVNSNIPTQKEITQNGVGGFLVDPDEPMEFSEKFQQLLKNKKLYSKKSKEAKKLAIRYNWEEISRETEKIYEKII
ncbi:MAG: glycosyltransferase family 4 protein [bacterium]|nr:glycosyltransferase family 4 protein [bacterium]